MTEARDALAVALERSDAAHVHRLDPCPACTLIADAILAALPDGWVLARRQDAEDGAARIAAERRRQVEVEGYTSRADAETGADELALAGIAYAMRATHRMLRAKDWWPWADEAWKPTGDRVRDLTKAGALIAAAIDAELHAARKAREALP